MLFCLLLFLLDNNKTLLWYIEKVMIHKFSLEHEIVLDQFWRFCRSVRVFKTFSKRFWSQLAWPVPDYVAENGFKELPAYFGKCCSFPKSHSTHGLTKKLMTEKCKQQANQPEKIILKIKILWKFSLEYLSRNAWKKNIILLKWMFVSKFIW